MKEIIAIVLSIVVSLGTVVPASAGEGYIKGPNGRLTYWNDGQPGYNVAPPAPRRQYHSVPRSWGRSQHVPRDYHRNRHTDNFVAGAILLGAGAVIGAAIANSQQPRQAQQLTPEQQHCADTNGVWLKDIHTGYQFCGWRQ